MWEGKWNRKLELLYDLYIDKFNQEPDINEDMKLDDVSYNQWISMIKKSIIMGKPL